MLEIIPYKLDDIKNNLKRKAINELGLVDAEFEGSNVSQLINLLSYSTVINNTNFTFGLNEMFITQARDRRNVIKHARQMGYSHKRKVSYQYKIKLKVLKSGEISLNKYTKFKSAENNYIYLGENITNNYGTHAFLKTLTNEYNNNASDIYSGLSVSKGKYIITESGQVCKVLTKEPVGEPRLLLEVLDDTVLNTYSQESQDVYIHNGTYNKGYRNLTKIGNLDTFITDVEEGVFKVQMSPELGVNFPSTNELTSTGIIKQNSDNNYVLELDVENDIFTVISLTVNNGGSDVTIPLDSITVNGKNLVINNSVGNILDYNFSLVYNTIKDDNGNLIDKIFFSDFRGEKIEHETNYDKINNPLGWSGFYAFDYNPETNILYFNIKEATYEEQQSGVTYGQPIHNPYMLNGSTLSINKVLNTPYKRTRFSLTEEIIENNEIIGYTPFDRSSVFASLNHTELKDELEIIVKEGTIKRWNDETEESKNNRQYALENNLPVPEIVYENPELTIPINEDMVEAGYFSIKNKYIENNGIELFITRVLPDGSIEINEPWESRQYLLAEQEQGKDKTFVALSDENYEDYINIYTKYAGTGTPLSLDMTVKMNYLISKGSEGDTNRLIEPIDTELFEARYYVEESLTPTLLHVEGSDLESTEDIRHAASLISNTANRTVTSNDYKTICEAQPYIQSAKIWGGEDETPNKKPGHIFFSIIPYSRPNYFSELDNKFVLNKIDTSELFYPTYYQITGKERYDTLPNTKDENVLFNLLEHYKIITLQLNYVKSIYLDTQINIEVLKYKFGQTVKETNKDIFTNIQKYFVREIEKYDSIFYRSSLSRYIDERLGDNYGINLNVSFSVDLYDSLYEPDRGTFINSTLKDLTDNDNLQGLVGDNDNWKFIMPLEYPIEDMFSPSTIVNNIRISDGRIIIDNITNCNTRDFIKPGDFIYMELDDGTFVSHDINGDLETSIASENSEVIEISIMYVKKATFDANGKYDYNNSSYKYKVGSYFIHRSQHTIRLELNTNNYLHIDAQSVVTEDMINNNVEVHDEADANVSRVLLVSDINKKLYYRVDSQGSPLEDQGEKIFTLNVREENYDLPNIVAPYVDLIEEKSFVNEDNQMLYKYKTCSLPREYFIDKVRTLKINPKNSNISTSRNVFTRLEEVSFI